MNSISVYGTEWCHDTQDTRQHLDELGIEYRFIDVEEDPDADDWVKLQNDGKEKFPTVKVGRTVLSVPSNGELDVALRKEGIIADA